MTEENQDFSEVLNNVKSLTLGHLFKIAKKLKYTTVVWLFATFTSCMGAAYVAGQYEEQKEAGVSLQTPFAMRIKLRDEQHDFEHLTLIRDPILESVQSEDKVVMSIREVKNEFDVVPVGTIVATVERKDLRGVWKYILANAQSIDFIPEAHAYEPRPIPMFNLNGHGGDYDFYEEFMDNYTVHRYYSDGCVLEYKVDDDRRPIPGTFVWVVQTH